MFLYSFKQSVLTQGILIDFLNKKKYSIGRRSVNRWWASPHKFSWCFHCWGLTLAANNTKMWFNDARQQYTMKILRIRLHLWYFQSAHDLRSCTPHCASTSNAAKTLKGIHMSCVYTKRLLAFSHTIGPCQEGFRTWGPSIWSSISLLNVHSKNVHPTPTGPFNVLSPLLDIWVARLDV